MVAEENNLIKARIFVVGCPRSGTTLLQSLIAAHSEIQSFPESHFFVKLVTEGSLRARLGIPKKEFYPWIQKYFQEELKRPDLIKDLTKFRFSSQLYVNSFLRILDSITIENKKTSWLEKTPDNLSCINYMEKKVKNAKFIHIIRNGDDVVASLYEVTQKYPQYWGNKWDINRCIQRWINDVRKSHRYIDSPNHKILKYEELVRFPELTLKEIQCFIGLDYQKQQLDNRNSLRQKIVSSHEVWKDSACNSIDANTSGKFMQIFNESQRELILKTLKNSVKDLHYFNELTTQ